MYCQEGSLRYHRGACEPNQAEGERADELYLILRGTHPNIGHATVYRALRLFAAAGIAREVNRRRRLDPL
ncbi:transcriptional repressor [Geomonas anaerohicana]|uniref:transcriptional repressor n=1 Tax=Geomonas anaerohicana TaxID=2798583 RepID=UPI0022A79810|nr:transcriptional repressor [Geomonas anaerohicana]